MSQSAGPRIVSKFIERVQLDFDDSASPKCSINYTNGNNTGWHLVPASANTNAPILQWQGYIDLSGYRPDNMVLFPTAVEVQRGSNMWSIALEPASGGVGAYSIPGGEVFMQYALTTDKVDDIDFGLGTINEPLVGFISDNSEMDQVIYSCTETWGSPANGTNIGLILNQKHVAGDGIPIVGPRIYVTIRALLSARWVADQFRNTTWLIPPMRFVIAGEAREVEDYQLMHLMKRQIDLQQSPDVDV